MTKTIEKRLEDVERELASLKEEVKSLKPDPNWISSMCGTFKDDPEFDEVLRLGREFCDADAVHLWFEHLPEHVQHGRSGSTADPTESRDQP